MFLKQLFSKQKTVLTTESYITPSTENNSPVLHIVDNSKEITLCLIENKFIQIINKHNKMSGQSSGNFKELLFGFDDLLQEQSNKNSLFYNFIDKVSIQLNRDLIIYSCICEACSKAGVSYETIENNMKSLADFVEESLHHYNYNTWEVKLNLSLLKEFIPIKHVKHKRKRGVEIRVSPISSKGTLLGITTDSVYIQQNSDNLYKIRYPETFYLIYYAERLSNAITSLLWILLFTLELYEEDFDNIRNSMVLYESDLRQIPFYNT